MNSRDPEVKLSPKQFNWIYANAKCTLVCDKELLATKDLSSLHKAVALSESAWNTRLWTMQEAMLSKELCVLQHDDYHWSVNTLLSDLIVESRSEGDNAGVYYELIRNVAALVCHDENDGSEKSLSNTLDRVVYAGRLRRARKPLHLVKAVFPLFNIKWPPTLRNFEEAHTILMEKLDVVGHRCISLYAPFGIPGPYSWAPLSLIGAEGTLVSEVETHVAVHRSKCFASRWFALRVMSNAETPQSRTSSYHWTDLLPINHEVPSQQVVLTLEDHTVIHGTAYYAPSETFPWALSQDNPLWLVRPRGSYDEKFDIKHYVVARMIKEENEDRDRLWTLKKIGVVKFRVPDTRAVADVSSIESEIFATWGDFPRNPWSI